MEMTIQVIGIGWLAVLALQVQGFFAHRRGLTQKPLKAAAAPVHTAAPTFGEPAGV